HLMVLSSLHVSRSKNVVCSLPVQFFISSRRRHTSPKRDWSSDVCSSDLIVSTTEPKNPITMAGKACFCVPLRACSKVVMNGFHSVSLISMTLGINVSPEIGRLNIDTLGRRNNLDNSTTSPQPFEPVSEASKDQDRNLVWLDAEMTGLYPGIDALVEVAIIITDADLNIIDDGIDIIIKPPAAAVKQMDPFVVEMHRTNGLAEQWQNGVTAAEAEQRLLD